MKGSASALPHLQEIETQRNETQHSLKILDYCSSVDQVIPAIVKCTHKHTTTLCVPEDVEKELGITIYTHLDWDMCLKHYICSWVILPQKKMS